MIEFYNPFNDVIKAAENIYGNISCYIQFDAALGKDNKPPYGETAEGENGEIIVSISAHISILNALEILAHELAHVIVGFEELHSENWDDCFHAIWGEYKKILKDYKND